MTVTAVKLQLAGSEMKKVKDMLKGHRHNKFSPVADYVKFEVYNEQLTITYADYNKTNIQLAFEAEVVENQSFLFPIDVIKKLGATKSDDHEFNLIDTYTVEHIENGISQKHSVIECDQFPKLNYENKEFKELTTLDYNTIQQLKLANISAGKSESRPILTTVLLRNNKMISTDSMRLFQTKTNFELDQDIVIPNHIIRLIDSLTDKGDSITLSVDADLIKLSNNKVTIYVDGVLGAYPDVSRLIPQDFNTVIYIDEYDKFKKTLETIKKSSKEKNNVAMIHFDGNKINLTDRNNTIQSEIKITEIASYSELKQIAFSAEFLLDALKQINSKQINIKFVSNMRPFIVESVNSEDELALILPVRLTK